MSVPSMIMLAEVRTRWIRARVRTRAPRGRGGRDMTAGSTGSTPRDCAGGPSIRISRKCISGGQTGTDGVRSWAHLSKESAWR